MNAQGITFQSNAIEQFSNNYSGSSLKEEIIQISKNVGKYPYLGAKYMSDQEYLYSLRSKFGCYLDQEKKELLEKQVIRLLVMENDRFTKKIPTTKEMLFCRFVLFALLEACIARGGDRCYFNNDLNGYRNDIVLRSLLNHYYPCNSYDDIRFSKYLLVCVFDLLEDAKQWRDGWPPLAFDNFIEALKQDRPAWFEELQSISACTTSY